MAYQIEFKPSAARAFGKLPRSAQQRIAPKIDALAREPRPPGCEKLSGGAPMYRIRVGDFRIIYDIRDDQLLVLVVAIGHRREIYRRRRGVRGPG